MTIVIHYAGIVMKVIGILIFVLFSILSVCQALVKKSKVKSAEFAFIALSGVLTFLLGIYINVSFATMF